MLTRSLIWGMIALTFEACMASVEGVNPGTKQPESLMGVRIEGGCSISEPVSNLITNGSLDRRIWENVFRDVRGDYFVETFLRDWKRGDNFTLLKAYCFEEPVDRETFYIDVITPRLGTVEINAEVREDEMIATRFLILSNVISEI